MREFQSIFGLPPTGVTDFATWYKVSHIYVAVSGYQGSCMGHKAKEDTGITGSSLVDLMICHNQTSEQLCRNICLHGNPVCLIFLAQKLTVLADSLDLACLLVGEYTLQIDLLAAEDPF